MQETDSNRKGDQDINQYQEDDQQGQNIDNVDDLSRSQGATAKPETKSPGREFADWAVTLGIAIVLALIIRQFLFAIFIVDGESMYPTLKNSEWLVVNKAIYLVDEPEKGEIIVFHATQTRDYIKRVIAVEGDELEISNGVVYVNGEIVEEPYINEPMEFYNNYPKVTVPENKIFVMGDNRNKSADSRMHDIGFIDLDEVVGRAEVVFWPLEEVGKIH